MSEYIKALKEENARLKKENKKLKRDIELEDKIEREIQKHVKKSSHKNTCYF
jgi:regulator of replication initiation timing